MTTHDQPTTEALSASQCWALLRDAPVGRLGVCAGGRPDILPVNFTVDHGTVVFRTAAGTKLAAAAGHELAFEADSYDVTDTAAWSVVVQARP